VGLADNTLPDQFWRSYAKSYDRILPLVPFYQQAVGRHVSAIVESGARRVLDLGCGTGNVAAPLAVAGMHVVAVDKCSAMLERLQVKALGYEVADRVTVVDQDAHTLEVPSQPFDAVNCLLALFCMTDGLHVLSTIVKSVRLGGLLAFTEPTWAFREEPLLEFASQSIFSGSSNQELLADWEVVANAGKTQMRARLWVT
jgi:ubiquinone/menaquinone biosynthesis C-methylase UbiE